MIVTILEKWVAVVNDCQENYQISARGKLERERRPIPTFIAGRCFVSDGSRCGWGGLIDKIDN